MSNNDESSGCLFVIFGIPHPFKSKFDVISIKLSLMTALNGTNGK